MYRCDLALRLKDFRDNDRLLEAQRLEQRVHYDIEMMREIGYCSGIENSAQPPKHRALAQGEQLPRLRNIQFA